MRRHGMHAVSVQVRGKNNRTTRAGSDSLGRLPVCCQCQVFLHVILARTYVYILEMVSKVSNNKKFHTFQRFCNQVCVKQYFLCIQKHYNHIKICLSYDYSVTRRILCLLVLRFTVGYDTYVIYHM